MSDLKNEVQKEITELGPEPSTEQLKKTVIYMTKVFEIQEAANVRDWGILLKALHDTQKERDKLRHALHKTRRARFIMFIKKILISHDWYEVSTEELQLIHNENFGASE